MTAPIFHIGYHKTATTWFQESFYPAVRNHRYVPREEVAAAILRRHAFGFQPEVARDRLGLAGDGVILCDEGLSGYPHNGGLAGCFSKEMAHRLHALRPDARIVIFIRRQPEMIAACYLQYLRAGGTHAVHRYLFHEDYHRGALAEPHKAPRFAFEHFSYGPLVALYQDLFGRGNVFVYPYEAFQAAPTAFCLSFAETLGLDLDAEALSLAPRNRSYGAGLARAAQILNHFTRRSVVDKTCLMHIPFWYGARARVLEQLNVASIGAGSADPVALLGAATVAWIEQYYGAANRELAERLALPLARLGYPITTPRTPTPRPRRPRWLRWSDH